MIAVEAPGLAGKAKAGERRTFWVLLTLGLYMCLAVALGWPVPTPTPVLEALFRPLSAVLGLE